MRGLGQGFCDYSTENFILKKSQRWEGEQLLKIVSNCLQLRDFIYEPPYYKNI